MLKRIDMKNKERIQILESEISRLKVANRNNTYRIEAIESHLAEQHKGANFSKLNSSEIPNTCLNIKPEAPECVANNGVSGEPIKPDFIPDWKDAPGDAVAVAMDKDGQWCWYDRMPRESISVFEGAIARAGFATNAYLLPPDYWKSTLMMRPEANAGDWATAPDWAMYKAMDKSGIWNWFSSHPYKDNREWIVKTGKYKLIPNHPPSDKPWNETLEMRPEAISDAPDYSHLLPDGYEFCSEADAVKWVKVEMFDAEGENEYGFVVDGKQCCNKPHYRPIRPIQYKVTTHEITTAVPDPYMPDWSQAPEGTVAHAWDESGLGYWYIRRVGNTQWEGWHISSNLTLPADLDWKQSLRVKPN
jgi:hypothetical protein